MTLDIVTADNLASVSHGFFTRRGGASSGIFAGLNCGYGSSDQREAVDINRERAAAAMNLRARDIVTVHQVHSADVIEVTAPFGGSEPRADAMVSRTPGIALAVLSADCQPVLLADPRAGVIGAAHAGWKGALAGVLEATVDAMVGLGARRERIQASIGPCISQHAYEVGPEILDTFMIDAPGSERFFAQGNGDRLQFNLPGFGLERLRAAGVHGAEWTRHCTYSDQQRFFSYRRATHRKEADYGRHLSAIRL